MKKVNKSLAKAISQLRIYNVEVDLTDYDIIADFSKSKDNVYKLITLLTFIINNFEDSYFILIKGVPFCLMPGLSCYLYYRKQEGVSYRKTKECGECKYNYICPGLRKEWVAGKTLRAKPVRDLPEEIIIEVTPFCNLNCPLCFKAKSKKNVSLGDVKKIIDESYSLGIKAVRFTGGEPLLYGDLEKAFVYAKRKGFYVTVNTNATLFNDYYLNLFKDYVDNTLISLQGFNSYTESKLLGKEINFNQKIRTIAKLSRRVPAVRIGTIISRTLSNNFNKYYNLLGNLKITKWELYRPMTDRKTEEFSIDNNILASVLSCIKKSRKEGLFDVRIFNPMPFCITDNAEVNRYVLFGGYRDDGHSRLVYDAKGFRPSYPIYKYLGKNILEAWNNPFLRKLRSLSYLPDYCKECFYLQLCKGGSRYISKVEKGSFFVADSLANKSK